MHTVTICYGLNNSHMIELKNVIECVRDKDNYLKVIQTDDTITWISPAQLRWYSIKSK